MNPTVKNVQGFTLVEIILVVFIITLLTAAVLPSFVGYGQRGIESDARAVASIVRFLNDASQNTLTEQRLHISLDEKEFTYMREDRKEIKEIESLYSAKVTSSDTKKEGDLKLTFPAGGLYEKMAIRLYGDSKYLDVLYNPYNGKVIVEERSPEEIEKEKGS